LLGIFLLVATPVWAQPAEDPYRPIRSLGLPPHFTSYGGFSAVAAFEREFFAGGILHAGLRHELVRPAMGILGMAAEGFGGMTGAGAEGGVRVYGTMRALMFRAGAEFSSTRKWTPLFTVGVEHPIVRGGVLVPGGLVRIDWTPAAHRVGLGVSMPLFQPMAGRTRPVETKVRALQVPPLPRFPPVADSIAALLGAIEASALWIDEMTTPFLASSLATDKEFRAEVAAKVAYIARTDSAAPEGHAYPVEVTRYHRLLGRLFGDDSITALARRVVLEEVVIPMNARFGMLRDAEVFAAFSRKAVYRFGREMTDRFEESSDMLQDRMLAVRAWLGVLSKVEHRERRRWRDSRLIWLPFQLALRPDEHDSQPEVDALVEQLLGQPFRDRNDYTYLINEAFSPELIRSIHAARSYHVLWVHDFAGTAPDGRVDRVAARVVVEGYLAALADGVRQFDRGGTLPAFMIFLDQWYFDFRRARWWMKLLADPLGTTLRLPEEAADVEAWVADAQRKLREAVSASSRLHALARERGSGWLRDVVKVHVSITYPGDPSFRRRIPARNSPLMFADDYMRDHRKVAFWDLSEADPALGGALFTGEGVGENYEGASWEDRTLLVHGAAALPLKQAARRLFLDHGFAEADLPPPLLPDAVGVGPPAADSLPSVWSSRLLQAPNATGYGPKQASVLKAALYNLMPPGSRILAPDSQWSSFFWAGMLVGTALRGCHVFVIAPRLENAPYALELVQSVLAHDVLEGYLQLRSALAPAFAASGGGLYVGLYGQDISTRSLRERYLGVIKGLQSPRFPRAAFPFPEEVYRQLGDTAVLARLLEPVNDSSQHQATLAIAPRLHLKSQLFVSGEGLERVLRDPAWFRVFTTYVAARAREYASDHRQAAGGRMSPALLGPVEPTLIGAPASERSRDVFYLLTGSQNQNDRSLYLDGEIMCLIAGPQALATLIDFVAIAARSDWECARFPHSAHAAGQGEARPLVADAVLTTGYGLRVTGYG
jgi:hypothetical protein